MSESDRRKKGVLTEEDVTGGVRREDVKDGVSLWMHGVHEEHSRRGERGGHQQNFAYIFI